MRRGRSLLPPLTGSTHQPDLLGLAARYQGGNSPCHPCHYPEASRHWYTPPACWKHTPARPVRVGCSLPGA